MEYLALTSLELPLSLDQIRAKEQIRQEFKNKAKMEGVIMEVYVKIQNINARYYWP